MLKQEYCTAFAYLRSIRRLILAVTVGFFLITIVTGICFFFAFEAEPDLLTQLMKAVGELLGGKGIIDENGQMNAFRLFLANFIAVIFSILYGAIPFLFLPVWTMTLNATMIGVVGAAALQLGLPMSVLIASLLPHGIFEIPALLLGGAFGIRLCHSIVRRIFRRPEPRFLALMTDLTRVTVLIILPLLIAAALVESYLTGPIASLFM